MKILSSIYNQLTSEHFYRIVRDLDPLAEKLIRIGVTESTRDI